MNAVVLMSTKYISKSTTNTKVIPRQYWKLYKSANYLLYADSKKTAAMYSVFIELVGIWTS